jgi:hypothetical protein
VEVFTGKKAVLLFPLSGQLGIKIIMILLNQFLQRVYEQQEESSMAKKLKTRSVMIVKRTE